MKNSVAIDRWQDEREISLAATGRRGNVRIGFVDLGSLLPVAACYRVIIFLKIFIT